MVQRELVLTVDTRDIAPLVEQCLGNEEAVVRHPLGFLRVPLYPGKTDMPDLNLHIWPPGLKLNDGNDIHYHVFQMRSRIIVGGLTDILYADETVCRECESAHWRYMVYYEHGQQVHVMRDTGVSVVLTEFERRTKGPGHSYYVPRGVYHRTVLDPACLTLTLIDRWGHDPSMPCHVLCQPGSNDPLIYHPNLLPWDQTWEMLKEAVHILQAGS